MLCLLGTMLCLNWKFTVIALFYVTATVASAVGLVVARGPNLYNVAAVVHAGRVWGYVPKEKLPLYNVFAYVPNRRPDPILPGHPVCAACQAPGAGCAPATRSAPRSPPRRRTRARTAWRSPGR